MYSPSISVIIPTLNRTSFLEQTLASLRSQTFQNWEAIVVDDGSTADAIALIQQWIQQDSRLRLVQRQYSPQGAPACRNLGTQLSRGNYLIYLDSDDYLATTALERRFEIMERNPDLDFAVFPCIVFREHPRDLDCLFNIHKPGSDIDRFLGFDVPWQTMGPIWRRDAVTRIGLWDEALLSWQDVELHVRAIAAGLNYRKFDQPDCFFRVFQKNSVGMQSRSVTHLNSHKYLLPKLQRMLTQHGLNSPETQNLLSGIYFWQVQELTGQGYPDQALEIWQLGYEQGAIAPLTYRQGLRYVQTARLPFALAKKVLRRLLRGYFRLTWPPARFPKPSNTFLKMPVDRDRIPALHLCES